MPLRYARSCYWRIIELSLAVEASFFCPDLLCNKYVYMLPSICGLLCKQSISTLLAGSQVWVLREARSVHSLLHPIWAIPRCRRNGDLHWLSRHVEDHVSFLSWMFASCFGWHHSYLLLGLHRSFATHGSLTDSGY